MRLIGREELDLQLRMLIDKGNINRTFLFLGSKDSGKTFMGKYFASLILGMRAFKGTHPDFFYFKGRQGKYADTLEEFIEACHKQPFEAKHVVVFFDDIDLIPLSSLNVLLKTLEEPPAKTTIILSSHSQESLLDTIISRSFKIQLKSRSREEKEDILFDMGIKNASYRLAISDDIKVCASKDFQELEKRVSDCFSAYDKFKKCSMEELPKEIGNFLEKFDLKFFFESIRHKDVSLEYQFEITKRIQQCLTYNNKFLVLFNFIMNIR